MDAATTGADQAEKRKRILDVSVVVAVRLAILAGLVIWCFQIFRPFVIPIITAIIIAVTFYTPFQGLLKLVGGRRGLAGTLFALIAIAITIYPTFKVVESVVESTRGFSQQIQSGELQVPPPRENVRGWPIVGPRIYEAWSLADSDIQAATERYAPQIRTLGTWIIGKIRGLLGTVGHLVLALIISGIMLAYAPGGVSASAGVLKRIGGPRAESFVELIGATIKSVALGVLGIATVQATLVGAGFFFVHIPGWGIWTVLVLVLGILQLPAVIVTIPAIIYFFSAADSTGIAIVFAVWSLLAGTSDMILKPIFLGRGLDVPMPVILIGAIGGLILYGLIGLFVGAVVLAVGWELFEAWLLMDVPPAADEGAAAVSEPV
ncbi:MAG: AI-2E family transporter [Gemmatimonadota bacterium]|nr:AI-2E family transporter [Gemmatimonadota bacterium]